MIHDALLRWDGLHLVVSLDVLQLHLDRLMRRSERVTDLVLEGHEDTVRVIASVRWKGITSRASLDLTEIRLRDRHLGFRMQRPTVLGGLRLPRRAIEAVIRAVDSDGVTVFGGDGIVVVDLNGVLPPELEVSILTVQATGRSLHLWFGSGGLSDLPTPSRQALSAGAPHPRSEFEVKQPAKP